MMRARAVLIAGPTASGKSALALAVAERDGGVVINADASQVYDCWRVLTARPDDADLARAPHRLYGHVPATVRYSVGTWLRDVAGVLADARRDGLRPIVVGGTGLYFTALTEGLADIPQTPAALRSESSALIALGRLDTLRTELERDDPATSARIDRRNPMRVQRAWEVLRATGRGLAAWHADTPMPLIAADATAHVVIAPDIYSINNNIERRFIQMLEHGGLEECRRFLADGHDPALPAARVLGAAPLIAHLRGDLSLEAATAEAITATRQFAKRQRTWFRNRMSGWTRLARPDVNGIPFR
jgi:tRNA dimethylallyltransferase